MSTDKRLPYPILTSIDHDHCGQCGYPLEGIPAPGQCPECGLAFDAGICALRITGIAKSAAGPKWRKPVWVLIAVVAYLMSQIVALTLFTYPLVALGLMLAVVAAVVAMALTGKQKKTGTETFTFSRYGFSRWTLKTAESERDFVAWPGVKCGFTMKQVSVYWATLKLRAVDENGKHTTEFQAGIRCRAEDIRVIGDILDQLAKGLSFDEVDGIEQVDIEGGENNSGDDEEAGFYITETGE